MRVTDQYERYDSRKLSYANTFTDPKKRFVIKTMEFFTGKLTLLSKIRAFEKMGIPHGQAFWARALGIMGVTLETPDDEIARIPKTGPVIIVANHPHGLVDGMLIAELVGRVRTDYKILTRSLLTGVDAIDEFMIPVPFDHEEGALAKSLEMRKRAMTHLATGGVIILFPSGKVANSDTMFGPVVEAPWNPFTAQLVFRSKAQVVPVFFPGRNSRAYQIAAQVSATVRQGLLIHEVAHALNKPQRPYVGQVIAQSDIAAWSDNPRGFVAWLRDVTLGLGQQD